MSLMKKIRTFSLSATGLRVCGLLFLAMGVAGSILQRVVLKSSELSNSQLLEVLQDDPSAMRLVTITLVLLALANCAIPIFAFLLVEGATHTASYGKYLLRVWGLAVLCEPLYNLAIQGNLIATDSRNPVFGTALALTMLYFYRRYTEHTAGHIAIKILALLGAFAWCGFLGVADGACCVILTAALWSLRGRQNLQSLGGIAAMLCCAILSPLYIAAVPAFLIVYFYGGEKGTATSRLYYCGYPLMLLAAWVLTQTLLR